MGYLDEVLFAGTKSSGLYSSNDFGSNWSQCSSGINSNEYIRCIHVYDTLVFAGTNNGEVLLSYDKRLNGAPNYLYAYSTTAYMQVLMQVVFGNTLLTYLQIKQN